MLRVGSCFSGIGGLDLGLERTGGFKTAWFIENDPHCQRVLRRHWPDVPVFGDIHKVGVEMLSDVDIMAGGYPCQPFSKVGGRKGEDDNRYLWPQMRRLVRLLRPRCVLIENVPGHVVLGLDAVLCDLAEDGYDAEWGLVSAAGSCGAPHPRKRLFVVAVPRGERLEGLVRGRATARATGRSCRAEVGDPTAAFRPPTKAQPQVGRGANGLSGRVGVTQWPAPPGQKQHGWEPHRTCRNRPRRATELKALGNAVVPQVAEYIGRRILEATDDA